MATGYAGSTLAAELNRLANSGTYPALTNYMGFNKAANTYASTTNYSMIAALNIAAGITDPKQYLGLNAVCNTLAGTTNYSAVAALRSINL